MSWSDRVIAAHTAVTTSVSHAQRIKSNRYFVWREDGADDLNAEGRHVERVMSGITDLYTKIEFDPWADELGESLSAHHIVWGLTYVDFEEDTGFWHYHWDWEATN